MLCSGGLRSASLRARGGYRYPAFGQEPDGEAASGWAWPAALDGLPAGDHCGESDLPARGGKGCPDPCPPLPRPVPHQRPKGGGRSHHQHPLPYGAPLRRAGGGPARRSLAPPVSQRTREIRVVPLPVRRFVEVLDHNGEGFAL